LDGCRPRSPSGCAVRRIPSSGPRRSSISGHGCRPAAGQAGPVMVALVLMVVADATILTLAIRFTGIGPDVLPSLLVVGTFCTAYPLTVMPLLGFGV
jgi:hypothetical protein